MVNVMLTRRGRAILAPLVGLFLVLVILWVNNNQLRDERQSVSEAATLDANFVGVDLNSGGAWHLDLLPDLTPYMFRANGSDIEYVVRSGNDWRFQGTGATTLFHLRSVHDERQGNTWWFTPSILLALLLTISIVNYDTLLPKKVIKEEDKENPESPVEEAVKAQQNIMST
jgi:hypothetical protein